METHHILHNGDIKNCAVCRESVVECILFCIEQFPAAVPGRQGNSKCGPLLHIAEALEGSHPGEIAFLFHSESDPSPQQCPLSYRLCHSTSPRTVFWKCLGHPPYSLDLAPNDFYSTSLNHWRSISKESAADIMTSESLGVLEGVKTDPWISLHGNWIGDLSQEQMSQLLCSYVAK